MTVIPVSSRLDEVHAGDADRICQPNMVTVTAGIASYQ